MNLSQLKFARALAELGSFSKAAERCCVTQPSLSNAVARLEEELGARIFSRTTRRVALTQFGEHAIPLVTAVLNATAELSTSSRAFLDPAHKILRIGLTPLANTELLYTLVEPFRRQHPDVEILYKECYQDDLRKRLAEQSVDIALLVQGEFVHRKAVGKCVLYREPLLYLPKNSRTEFVKGPVPVAAVANDTFALTGEGCGLTPLVRKTFRSQRQKLKEYPGKALRHKTLEEWADLGIAAAILPLSKVSLPGPRAAARPLIVSGNKAAEVVIEALWRKDSGQASWLKEFVLHLKNVVPAILHGLSPEGDGQTAPTRNRRVG